MNTPGIYGKLPSHGDFLQRNLPSAFVSEWDAWLQQFISGTKEQIGADWLETYLTSPIWRFVLSPGVFDAHSWAGILMPSVDMVGRYFPFTIALQLAGSVNPSEFISSQTQWFCELEELALLALDGEYELEDMLDKLAEKTMNIKTVYAAGNKMLDSFDMHFDTEFEEQSASAIYPQVLDVLLTKLMKSYSIWSTSGSDRISPCVLTVKHIPTIAKLPAMLDGDWQRWGWQEPYSIEAEDTSLPSNMVI